jgi:dipeptidyl aminopeptidase/acylaminoacyl peptidase
VAFDGIGEAGGLSAVWVADLDSPQISRVTFGQGESTPVWSPDGESLCYRASTGSTDEIRVKKLGGAERVLFSGQRVTPLDWSPDNRFVAVNDSGSVKLLPLDHDGSQMPVPLDLGRRQIGARIGAQQARFSPDGKYLALVAVPGAESEVHIVPMPPATGDWTIAKGAQPVWRRDGRELFYLRPDLTLMSVEVSHAASLQLGLAKPLFVAGIDSLEAIGSNGYEASADGQRFLIRVPEGTSSSPLTVMTNWWAVLKD